MFIGDLQSLAPSVRSSIVFHDSQLGRGPSSVHNKPSAATVEPQFVHNICVSELEEHWRQETRLLFHGKHDFDSSETFVNGGVILKLRLFKMTRGLVSLLSIGRWFTYNALILKGLEWTGAVQQVKDHISKNKFCTVKLKRAYVAREESVNWLWWHSVTLLVIPDQSRLDSGDVEFHL